jgi:hypothetical protein
MLMRGLTYWARAIREVRSRPALTSATTGIEWSIYGSRSIQTLRFLLFNFCERNSRGFVALDHSRLMLRSYPAGFRVTRQEKGGR